MAVNQEKLVTELKNVNIELFQNVNSAEIIEVNIENSCKMKINYLRDINILLKDKNELSIEKK